MNFQKRFPTKGGISFVFFPNPISVQRYLLFSILNFIPQKNIMDHRDMENLCFLNTF